MSNLYLYLARRDKKGVNVLMVMRGNVPAMRLEDVRQLGLPNHMTPQLAAVIHDNRMLWEPWVESAEDYTTLKQALISRGYSDVPIHGTPMFDRLDAILPPEEERKAPRGPKTMLRPAD